jgi:hypothetical protein
MGSLLWCLPAAMLGLSDPPGLAQQVEAFLSYKGVVEKTAGMVGDPEARRLAQKHGLNVLNLTWEDTARFKNSSIGPNISDMTIQVQQLDPRNEAISLTSMPVIRFPNFSDVSADVPLDKFLVLVGNEKGERLRKITLREYLENFRDHLHDPKSWKGEKRSLLAGRDSHALVSAQACFLPIPKSGSAEFNPVLFNYQSYEGQPAVLAILATREGTSATIIDNARDAHRQGMLRGQRIFFNQNGQRAALTGKRRSDALVEETRKPIPTESGVGSADEAGANMVLLIQVPLKNRPRPMRAMGGMAGGALPAPAGAEMAVRSRPKSDVEDAVVGHGKVQGTFTEVAGLAIERDERYPVRATVQFYKATSNGAVSERDLELIARNIDRVYKDADYVGSLVVEGYTGRPTEPEILRPIR